MSQFGVLGKLLGANFNVVTDQAIALAYGHCLVTHVYVTNPGGLFTLSAGGLYTAAAKGGTLIVPATQVYTGLAAIPSLALAVTPARVLTGQIFFALTTAQGSAATADLYVCGIATDQ